MSAPRREPAEIPLATRLAQARASNPEASAWVSANAGSGKTHVLAQRVLRLLLGGAPPARMLCLTFTKAAAANMAERVFRTLARMDAAFRSEAWRRDRRGRRRWTRRGASRLCAAAVRAHDRDARRPEDPDDPRLLRTAAASLSVRGQCRRRFSRDRRARRRAAARSRARAEALTTFLSAPDGETRLAFLGARSRRRTASTNCCARRSAFARRSPTRWKIAAASTGYREALADRLGLARGRGRRGDRRRRCRRGSGAPPVGSKSPSQLKQAASSDNDLAAKLAGRCRARRAGCGARRLSLRFLHQERRAARRRRSQDRHQAARGALSRPARAPARRAGPPDGAARKAQGGARRSTRSRGADRSRRDDSHRLCAAQGEARPSRFRRSDRAHAVAADPLRRRLGALQARFRRRSHPRRRGAGHLGRAMGDPRTARRGLHLGQGRARDAAHVFRRRRRKAVDLLVSGRRAENVRCRCDGNLRRRHRGAKLAFAEVPLHLSFRSAARGARRRRQDIRRPADLERRRPTTKRRRRTRRFAPPCRASSKSGSRSKGRARPRPTTG